MALRLLYVISPDSSDVNVRDVIEQAEDTNYIGFWGESLEGEQNRCSILVEAEEAEHIMDILHEKFEGAEGYRMYMVPVQSTLPRLEEEEEEGDEEKGKSERISRDELYHDLIDGFHPWPTYLVMVVLSTIVAAIGLIQGDAAVVIGAMVITPLLVPNVALSLASTLADANLARRALLYSGVGLVVSLVVATAIGVLLPVSPEVSEIASRTEIRLGNVVLALAAGGAGALAFTMGVSTAVVGVMVAVALLPALATVGLMAGSGLWGEALDALLLLLTNLIAINLAGVVTFLAQGIEPRSWYEAEQAKKSSRRAIGIWAGLLVLLVAVVYFSQQP